MRVLGVSGERFEQVVSCRMEKVPLTRTTLLSEVGSLLYFLFYFNSWKQVSVPSSWKSDTSTILPGEGAATGWMEEFVQKIVAFLLSL